MKRLTFIFKTKKEEPVVALVCEATKLSLIQDSVFNIKGYHLEIGLIDDKVSAFIHLNPTDVEVLIDKLEFYINELEQEIKDVH